MREPDPMELILHPKGMNVCMGCGCHIAPELDVERLGRHWHEACWGSEVRGARYELRDWPRRRKQLHDVLIADLRGGSYEEER